MILNLYVLLTLPSAELLPDLYKMEDLSFDSAKLASLESGRLYSTFESNPVWFQGELLINICENQNSYQLT